MKLLDTQTGDMHEYGTDGCGAGHDSSCVNCVLTEFGSCSYNKTGCSDCEIKNKIRKALEFAESQRLCCENCVNRSRKSKEVCTSPYGVCVFFDDKTQKGDSGDA